jgi:adenosylcobinamide kinase/adenosylcobinamide-phosphate guanylyltransferase
MASTIAKEKPVAVVLIGGGARSGKSRHALQLARARGSRLAFIATATAMDEDYAARIARHKADRGPDFRTVEEPIDVAGAIRNCDADAIVVDCLTLWLSNIFKRDIAAETERLIAATHESKATIIFVTNEVGCGIHPETAIGREFRDRAGILNQRIGAAADEVYLMAFGQPLRVK